MELVEESKRYTISVSEKEYEFIKWCIDNKDNIDIVKTPLNLKTASSKITKRLPNPSDDEIPF